jgi:hypothetical protein
MTLLKSFRASLIASCSFSDSAKRGVVRDAKRARVKTDFEALMAVPPVSRFFQGGEIKEYSPGYSIWGLVASGLIFIMCRCNCSALH